MVGERDGVSTAGNTARAPRFASRSSVVINADTHGQIESGDEWDPFSLLHKQDSRDLVEWAAKQSWSTGEDHIHLATKPVIARQTILRDAEQAPHLALPVIPEP